MIRKTYLAVVVFSETVPNDAPHGSEEAQTDLEQAIRRGELGLEVEDMTTWELGERVEAPPAPFPRTDLPKLADRLLSGEAIRKGE